jgi:hypothetical protein
MTTIHIKPATWKKLIILKEPGESMDDVIQKLLKITNEIQEAHDNINNLDAPSFENLLDEFCSIANEEIESVVSRSKKGFFKKGWIKSL